MCVLVILSTVQPDLREKSTSSVQYRGLLLLVTRRVVGLGFH